MTTWSPDELLTHEEWLAGIWRHHLHRGANPVADFFAQGGTAASAVAMLSEITEHFGSAVTLEEFRRDSSLQGLVRRLGGSQVGEELVTLRSTGSRPPLYLVAGAGGVALQFCALTRSLGPDQPLMVFQGRSMVTRHAPEYSLKSYGRRIAREINRLQPTGPLILGGHSLGGLAVLHTAHELRRRGREIVLVVTLDCFPGPHMLPRATRVTSQAAQRHVKRPELSVLVQMALAGWWRFPTPIQCQLHFRIGVARWMWARPAPPWEGHTTVIASQWEADYVAQTWPYLAPRHLDIVGVPGTHTSMLSVEHVEATADAVRTSIERVLDISPD